MPRPSDLAFWMIFSLVWISEMDDYVKIFSYRVEIWLSWLLILFRHGKVSKSVLYVLTDSWNVICFQSCLALRYEALLLRDFKSSSHQWLKVSYTEWLNFAEQSLDHGFHSVARKVCLACKCFDQVHVIPVSFFITLLKSRANGTCIVISLPWPIDYIPQCLYCVLTESCQDFDVKRIPNEVPLSISKLIILLFVLSLSN